MNVVMFTLLVYLVFAIFGVQFFGGKFGRCEYLADNSAVNWTLLDAASVLNGSTHRQSCTNATFGLVGADGSADGGRGGAVGADGGGGGAVGWITPVVNFDTTLQAFMALFELATFEG
jgi:hypothetical protein